MSVPARALIGAVRAYQLTLSPFFSGQCRFSPSCSTYAMQALASHGAVRGSRLAAWRVLRCSPLCVGGHDPVPPPCGTPPVGPRLWDPACGTPPVPRLTCTDANPEAV
jgi:putative membrane protein insertion efficiency factor